MKAFALKKIIKINTMIYKSLKIFFAVLYIFINKTKLLILKIANYILNFIIY